MSKTPNLEPFVEVIKEIKASCTYIMVGKGDQL